MAFVAGKLSDTYGKFRGQMQSNVKKNLLYYNSEVIYINTKK